MRWPALGIGILLCACTSGSADQRGAAGGWSDRDAWQLSEDLRIGGDREGRDDFDAVWDVTADRAGRIYVLLARRSEIRVFGPDGSYVRTIGRPGSGPGDFRVPSRLAWDSAGRLWVTDGGNGRYTIVDTSGKFVRTQPNPIRFGCRPVPCGWFVGNEHVDGGWVVLGPSVFQTRLVVVDSTGVVTKEVRLPLADSVPSTSPRLVPFAPKTVFAVSPAGTIWAGVNRDYAIRAMTFYGQTVRTISRPFTPIPISATDIQAARESSRQNGARAGFDGGIDTAHVGPRPAFAQLATDDAENLWVATAEREDGVATGFDVFDKNGRFLGRTRGKIRIDVTPLSAPPWDPTPVRIIGDYLYATAHDGDGRPNVVRIRIDRRASSAR